MPYVPPELKARIKREISVQRLAEARGIKLRRSGKELIGLCPFHQDTKSQPQHRSGEKRLALQRCVRRRRRRDRVGEAGRGHQLYARGGTAEAELSSLRRQHSRTAAQNLDRAQAPAVVPDERGRSKTAEHRGGLLPPNAEAVARAAAVSHQARPEIGGDGGALPAGLFQSLAQLPSAGQEPRRRCATSADAWRSWASSARADTSTSWDRW